MSPLVEKAILKKVERVVKRFKRFVLVETHFTPKHPYNVARWSLALKKKDIYPDNASPVYAMQDLISALDTDDSEPKGKFTYSTVRDTETDIVYALKLYMNRRESDIDC